MDILLLPGQLVAAQLDLPPGSLEHQAAYWVTNISVHSFTLRTLTTAIGRALGVSHPNHYRTWPRLPWRGPVRACMAVKIWFERVFVMGKRATGGFAGTLYMLTLLYRPGKVFLGRASCADIGLLQPVGITVARHLFMYAMTGAGKTTVLASIISTWTGSVFLVDPKSQITDALSEHDGRAWFVIAPYPGAKAHKSACYNAFDCIIAAMARDGDQAAVRWAIRVAQALVITPAGSRTPFFTDTARGFLVGVILHVLSVHPEHEHNLPYVRDLIVNGYRVVGEDDKEVTQDDEAQQLLLRTMIKNPAFDSAIAGAAAAMANAGRETAGNVRATLMEQMKWLDIPEVRAILRGTTLPLSELKTRNDVVLAFTAPVLSIREELAPLSRLLTNMLAYTCEAVRKKNGQCLAVIDELPSQGHNETLEVVLPVSRSQGLTFLGISQNTELMRKVYPQSWGAFSGEADAVFWMATNHNETARHLSQTLGKKSLAEKDRYSGYKSYREVDVMDPEQVKRFLSPESGNLIVTRAGGRALKLKIDPYFKALPVWCYAPDPDHRETLLRRLSRWLFDHKGRNRIVQEPEHPVNAPEASESVPKEVIAPAFADAENVISFPNRFSHAHKEDRHV